MHAPVYWHATAHPLISLSVSACQHTFAHLPINNCLPVCQHTHTHTHVHLPVRTCLPVCQHACVEALAEPLHDRCHHLLVQLPADLGISCMVPAGGRVSTGPSIHGITGLVLLLHGYKLWEARHSATVPAYAYVAVSCRVPATAAVCWTSPVLAVLQEKRSNHTSTSTYCCWQMLDW